MARCVRATGERAIETPTASGELFRVRRVCRPKPAEVAAIPAVGSRFSRDTTVAELTDWWLESVGRHQVKTSTLDSYRKFASYLANDIGTHWVVDVGAETLTQWKSKLLGKYAPYTVLNCREVSRQPLTEAVKFGLIPANPFDLVKAPRAKRVKAGVGPSPPPTPRR